MCTSARHCTLMFVMCEGTTWEAAQYACSNSRTSTPCTRLKTLSKSIHPVSLLSHSMCYKDLSPMVSLPTAD